MTTELALVQQAQQGDSRAFEELVNTHQQFVYNLALRATGNAHEAEDLAQEAFVRAWLALANFRGQAQFRTWLYRIVTNLCYNRLPHLRRHLTELGTDVAIDLPDEDKNVARQWEQTETHQKLHAEIEALPESYRLLITLRYQQDLSYDEIAQVLSLPVGTVKTGLFRAKAKLKEKLEEMDL
jgi:RNA polymerase sigma-70 factor (ECF subfamily)